MELFRTQSYEKALKRLRKLGATDANLDAMELDIAANPQSGDVIAGTDGLRKARFPYGNTGKRGGGRVIYYVLLEDEKIYLITAYAKVDQADLTTEEKRLFRTLVKELTNG